MRFTGTLKLIGIDQNRFRKELERELRELVAKSAFAWLNAALRPIPSWSGAARSTFSDLAATIGFQLSVQPKSSAPDRRARGEAEGTGELEINPKGVSFFRYTTTLEHLIFNEFNSNPAADPKVFAPNSIRGLPYGFQEKAQQAWQRVADTAQLPFPRFRIIKTIRI